MVKNKHCLILKFKFLVIIGFNLLLAGGWGVLSSYATTDDETDVISEWLRYTDVKNSLYHHFAGQAQEMLDQREQRVKSINTQRQWLQYQEEIRATLYDIVGPFPEKTPLHPRVTGVLERPDFTVEKIIFESQPGLNVTGALFLPGNLDKPAPAIVYASGHNTPYAFRSETYQHKIINLVKKGFVVFAFDPIGQGERLQYLDKETGRSRLVGSTNQHSYVGAQMFLTKSSLARYMIWDGIRAVDYLLTRSEVDPDRIGITGRSGGGTQAAYVAAFDDRIYAVATENWITSLGYLFQSRGPQDAEQNFYHGIAHGIDHADILLACMPRPLLLIATTRDYFSIQGTRDSFEQVKQGYRHLGKPNHALMVEDDHGHGSTRANREAMYAFFQKHLDQPGSSEDLSIHLFEAEELHATETGHLATSEGGESAISVYSREAAYYAGELVKKRENPEFFDSQLKKEIQQLAGYQHPEVWHPVVFAGQYQREEYVMEKYFIKGEGEYPIPFLLFRPHKKNNELIIYLHPEGKASEAGRGKDIEWWVQKGYTVVAPDLLGTGETGPGLPRGATRLNHVSYHKLFGAIQVGRSISGVRAGDINRLIYSVDSMQSIDMDRITVLANGLLTPDALHAAAFNTMIDRLILTNPLLSYESIASHSNYHPKWAHSLVAGALTTYDLPDLAALVAPRPVLYVNIQDEQMRPLSIHSDRVRDTFKGVYASYKLRKAENFPVILTASGDTEISEKIGEWMENN